MTQNSSGTHKRPANLLQGNNSTLITYKCDILHYIDEEIRYIPVAAATADKNCVITQFLNEETDSKCRQEQSLMADLEADSTAPAASPARAERGNGKAQAKNALTEALDDTKAVASAFKRAL